MTQVLDLIRLGYAVDGTHLRSSGALNVYRLAIGRDVPSASHIEARWVGRLHVSDDGEVTQFSPAGDALYADVVTIKDALA